MASVTRAITSDHQIYRAECKSIDDAYEMDSEIMADFISCRHITSFNSLVLAIHEHGNHNEREVAMLMGLASDKGFRLWLDKLLKQCEEIETRDGLCARRGKIIMNTLDDIESRDIGSWTRLNDEMPDLAAKLEKDAMAERVVRSWIDARWGMK